MKRSGKKQLSSRAADAPNVLAVSEFKARCLEILEDLRTSGDELLVTKHGVPIARVVPVRTQPRPLRGLLRGQLEIRGDIVNVDFSDQWEINR